MLLRGRAPCLHFGLASENRLLGDQPSAGPQLRPYRRWHAPQPRRIGFMSSIRSPACRYVVFEPPAESHPASIGHIALDVKHARKPSAENLPAGFDGAGLETGLRIRLVRHSQRKRGAAIGLSLRDVSRQSSLVDAICILLALRGSLKRRPSAIQNMSSLGCLKTA